MAIVLDILTWPLKKRLLLVAAGVAIYFVLVVVFSLTGLGSVPVVLLALLLMMVGSGLLGIKLAVPFTLVVFAISRFIVAALNAPLLISGLSNPVVIFLTLLAAGSVASFLGTLLRQLRAQQAGLTTALSERETALTALHDSEQQYRQLIEDISDVAYTCDAFGRCTYTSPAVKQLSGYEPDALIGQHFTMLIPDEWQQRVAAFYVQQYQARTPETTLQFPIMTVQGEQKWVEQQVVLIIDAARVTGFHAIVRDITARKLLERQLETARDQAVEALKIRTQILANVSHDARTPLSVILLRSELLKRGRYGALNAKQRAILDSILLNVNYMLGFVDNLLQESQLESDQRARPERKEIAPVDWLEKFTGAVQPQIDDKGLTLIAEVDDAVPTMLFTDPRWLEQIATNLVSNAVKFTDEGTVTIRILQADPAHWALQVVDTGIGMDPAVCDQIFKAFWQADGSSTRNVSRGVGLGLSVVDHLVRRLGGLVTVESELDEGSTFTVTLPLEIGDGVGDETVPRPPTESKSTDSAN